MYDDLIELAEFIAKRDAGRPKQASLRRAISTAYYAVFHRACGRGKISSIADRRLAPAIIGPLEPVQRTA